MSKEKLLEEFDKITAIGQGGVAWGTLRTLFVNSIKETRENSLKEAYEALINNPLLFRNDNLYSSVENIKPVFKRLISK